MNNYGIPKNLQLLAFLLIAIIVHPEADSEPLQQFESRYLSLKSGEVTIVSVPGVNQVAIGNPEIVNYKTLENGQVMLIGAAPGKTNIHIWGEGDRQVRYWVNVDQRLVSRDVEIAKTLTQDLPGLHIYQLDERVIIEGSILKRDAPKISAVQTLLPNAVMALTERKVDLRRTLRIDALIVEIADNDLKKIGVDWDDSMTGPNWAFHKTVLSDDLFKAVERDPSGINERVTEAVPFTGRGFYSYLGITSFLMSRINLLHNTGDARILSSPKLTTTDGQRASFNVGGEFPIPFTNENGSVMVNYKQYGITLEVQPDIEGDTINMGLKVELSDIDPSVTILGVPGTKRRTTETTVQLKDSQTLAISGLFQTEDASSDNKVPFLGDVPFVKRLFSSQDSNRKDKQIVVLITPHVVQAGDEKDRAMSAFAKGYLGDSREKLTIDQMLME